ncbi:PIG-X [Mycena floridula]|nr:PIG-X [Mycena floridula]
MLSSTLEPQAGFHTKLTTKITIENTRNCSLNLYFSLPPLLFVDPYELADYDDKYAFRRWGPSSLELPLAALKNEASTLLLHLKSTELVNIEVELPLHARYGHLNSDGYELAHIQGPLAFLSCPPPVSRETAVPNPKLPAHILNLFEPTSLVFLPENPTTHVLRVPVGAPKDIATVEFGTAITILLSFLYLCNVVRKTAGRMNHRKAQKQD